jgi:hypothetical protein
MDCGFGGKDKTKCGQKLLREFVAKNWKIEGKDWEIEGKHKKTLCLK